MNFTDLQTELCNYPSDRIVFVGLGNAMRGDDAAGLLFTDGLCGKKSFQQARFIGAGTNPENYLYRILNYKPLLVIFVDAVRNTNRHQNGISWANPESISRNEISTHAFSIRLVEAFLKAQSGIEIRYLLIPAYTMEWGSTPSPELQKDLQAFFGPAD